MSSEQFIKKIKKYSTISFILPLITINLCLVFYKMLGEIDYYPNFDWSNWENKKQIHLDIKKYEFIEQDINSYTFINCPINKYENEVISLDTLQAKITIKFKNELNDLCVKNHKFLYFILKNFNSFEKLLLYTKKNNTVGFAKIKNPYIYGEVSISRTARYFPATLIFKPLIILTSLFLFIYWKNTLNLFKKFEKDNILTKFSKNFFYFGLLSILFLILHASFLGVSIDSKIFANMRKLIIILFIFFEILAQIFLTKNLFRFKKDIKNYIHPLILKIKIIFVTSVILVTTVVFFLLVWGDLDISTKHILEWNYFSVLLIYYFLSRLLWKNEKKDKEVV